MNEREPRMSPSTLLRYERLEGLAGRSLEDLLQTIGLVLGHLTCAAGLVNLDDGWLKSVIGVPASTARDHVGLCAYAMMQEGALFVEDATTVPALAHLPLVKQDVVRAFYGVPLLRPDGTKRGALIAIGGAPRVWTAQDREILSRFVQQVTHLLELNQRVDELRSQHARQLGALSLLKGILKAATTFAIIGTDPQGRITLFSEGAERVFGAPSAEAIGKTPLILLDAAEVQAFAAKRQTTSDQTGPRPPAGPAQQTPLKKGVSAVPGFEALAAECEGDHPFERVWTMRRRDSTAFPGLLVMARVTDEDGNHAGYALLARDITEQRAVEKMKDDFVSMVSHELRTPLTSIRGALGLAAGGIAGEVSESLAELLHIAHSNTERLLRIVNDILDVHRLESGALDLVLATTDLTMVVGRAITLTQPYAAEHRVSLVLRNSATADPNELLIQGDFERLVQVVVNLVSNAVKFSPPGEKVEVDVERSGAFARIHVSDRGPGIPEELKPRLFQKFSQATGNDRRSGTGLGLSIVKSLVELHGGSVGFTTDKAHGTTFWVDLPAT